MKTISVVLPVYNEEETLPELFSRLSRLRDSLSRRYEIHFLLVDDGSTDRTLEFLTSQCRRDSDFKLIKLSRNFGHQAALLAGLSRARGDAVVAMDADLQDPPELIPQMLEQWELGSDVVYARRIERKGDSVFKRASARTFYSLVDWLSETKLPREVGDFRLMDQRIVELILSLPEKSIYLRGMVSWLGFRQTAVEFSRDARFAGETKYTMRKMLNLATDALLSFSERPLRVVTRLGLFVTTISFMVLMFFLMTLPLGGGNRVPGWFSVIAAVLILGGIQLVCIGIVGEYISRIYRETKGRPLFIVDDKGSVE